MFVHWGLYSGLAGNWNGQKVETKGGMEWIQDYVHADTAAYAKQAIPLFKPVPGFATEWVKLAKEAGCRYLVFTTKHHEGFGLHASKFGDYNAGAVLQRDLVKEIVEAAHAEGLRVGFYHSVIDWHHDQYDYSLSKVLPYPVKAKPNPPRNHAKYQEYLHNQVRELLSNYGPVDVLWWDFSSKTFQGDEAWRATDLIKMVRSLQPNIVMNNRLFAGHTNDPTPDQKWDSSKGDFATPEQRIPANGAPGVDWETCMTLNGTWGYSQYDHNWKSDQVLIRNLIDIASKGGNYLLNIGPKGDGTIPVETIKSMRAIGGWLKVNGEAIYGTRANPLKSTPWGRCTRKGQALYLSVFDWPKDGVLSVPLAGKPLKASLLADPAKVLPVKSEAGIVSIQLPPTAPDPIASVVKLEIEGEPR